jgi:DNA-binding transcriptional regulator/RsmH inhibitor MraZ
LYNRAEIWDEDEWNKYNEKNETKMKEITEGLKELGI